MEKERVINLITFDDSNAFLHVTNSTLSSLMYIIIIDFLTPAAVL